MVLALAILDLILSASAPARASRLVRIPVAFTVTVEVRNAPEALEDDLGRLELTAVFAVKAIRPTRVIAVETLGLPASGATPRRRSFFSRQVSDGKWILETVHRLSPTIYRRLEQRRSFGELLAKGRTDRRETIVASLGLDILMDRDPLHGWEVVGACEFGGKPAIAARKRDAEHGDKTALGPGKPSLDSDRATMWVVYADRKSGLPMGLVELARDANGRWNRRLVSTYVSWRKYARPPKWRFDTSIPENARIAPPF